MHLQAHNTKPLPLVLAIEPLEEKAFSTRLAGETEGLWSTVVITTVEQLYAIKQEGREPRCIGFHASQTRLANGRPWLPGPFHRALKELGWAGVTVLVSAGHGDTLKSFNQLALQHGYEGAVARDGWIAYLRERVKSSGESLGHADPAKQSVFIPNKAETQAKADIGFYANRLSPAVVVLREPKPGQAPQIVLENTSALGSPWSRHDFRRWAWLRAQLEVFRREHPEARPRAHLLDWDGEKKLPVECRLYDLGDGAFWYTRDWRWDRERAIDEVFARIESERSFAGRFDGLADYLAHRWSISRLRLLEVAALPEERGSLDEQGGWHGVSKETSDAFLVVPRLQSGLGWLLENQPETGNDKKQPSSWWGQRFTWQDFVNGPQSKPEDLQPSDPWLSRTEIRPAALQVQTQHYIYEATNQPTDQPTDQSCKVSRAVDWGNCKTRLLVLVPDASPRPACQDPGGENAVRPLTAMLAMDRRSDHLLGEKAKRFNPKEHQHIRSLSEGVIGEELDVEVVRSMNHGALSAVRDRVGQWLADARQDRIRVWDGHISKAIADTVGQGQGMAALSKLCDALLAAWPQLWDEERARLSISGELDSDTPQLPHLAQLFFVTPVGEKQVAMPAGSGAAWQHYSSRSSWPMVTPFADMLRNTPKSERADCWVMQDFKTWWKDLRAKNGDFESAAAQCFAQTGSWVAMRLPDAPGVAPVLLVAHFDGKPHQIWLEVLQLLHRVAHHVRAPFLLAWNEAQERSVWAASVAHEMKNMSLLALHDAQQNPSTSPLLLERLQQQCNLAEDFLFNLRPDLSPDLGLTTQAQAVDVKALLQASLSWWQEDQAKTELPEVNWAPGFDFSSVVILGAQAWQRVLRVLLHNAFQHGSGGVKLNVAVLNPAGTLSKPVLQLVVENLATETAVNLLNQTAHPSLLQIPSAYVRRHIGLKTAKALCQQAGAQLGIQAHAGCVTVSLNWPIQLFNTV